MVATCSDDCGSIFMGAPGKLSSGVWILGTGKACSRFLGAPGELFWGACVRGPGRISSKWGDGSTVLSSTLLIHDEIDRGAGESDRGESGVSVTGRTLKTVVSVIPNCISFLRMK